MVTLTCHCLDSRQVKCDREQVERPLANTFQNREYPSTEVEYKKDKFFFFSPSSFRGCNRHMEVRKSVKIPSKTLPPARLYSPSFFFRVKEIIVARWQKYKVLVHSICHESLRGQEQTTRWCHISKGSVAFIFFYYFLDEDPMSSKLM